MSEPIIYPPESLPETINALLQAECGWGVVKLHRGGLDVGGLIVVRDVKLWEKFVAHLNAHAQPAEPSLPTAQPSETP